MHLISIKMANLSHILYYKCLLLRRHKVIIIKKRIVKKVLYFYLLQKAGEITIRIVNSSSRPSNIKNDKIHFAAGSKKA